MTGPDFESDQPCCDDVLRKDNGVENVHPNEGGSINARVEVREPKEKQGVECYTGIVSKLARSSRPMILTELQDEENNGKGNYPVIIVPNNPATVNLGALCQYLQSEGYYTNTNDKSISQPYHNTKHGDMSDCFPTEDIYEI